MRRSVDLNYFLPSAYFLVSVCVNTQFVAALYNANGGNPGEYIKELCWNSENIYVKMVGCGKDIPNYLYFARTAELDILQEIAELDKETLTASLEYQSFLPEFTTTKLRLKNIYLHRVPVRWQSSSLFPRMRWGRSPEEQALPLPRLPTLPWLLPF